MTPPSQELLSGLFREHAGYVYSTLRRLGVAPRDLEDLTQDVFIAVNAALGTYDATRPAKPWLFAFCLRVASNYRRLARHRVELTGPDEGRATSLPSPEDALVASETRSKLMSALEVLSDAHRAVFVMHDIDGMSAPEIATLLEIPLNTAYSRIRLARRGVEAVLREDADGTGEP